MALGALLLASATLLQRPLRHELSGTVSGMVALIESSGPAADVYNAQFCGGVLVAPQLLLTAAHCVEGRTAESIEAIVGADNLCRDRAIDGVRTGIVAVTVHPQYDSASGRWDLARLQLADAFPESEVRTIVAPTKPTPAVALGWGTASPGGVAGCRLTRVDVQVPDQGECPGLVGPGSRPFDPLTMICSLGQAQDTCTGDSGGPLVSGSDPDRGIILGIVSWARGCGGAAGVYARAAGWHQGAAD